MRGVDDKRFHRIMTEVEEIAKRYSNDFLQEKREGNILSKYTLELHEMFSILDFLVEVKERESIK